MSETDFKQAKGDLAFSQRLVDEMRMSQKAQQMPQEASEMQQEDVEMPQEAEPTEVVEEQEEESGTEDKKDFYAMVKDFFKEMRGLIQNIAPKEEEKKEEVTEPETPTSQAVPPQM